MKYFLIALCISGLCEAAPGGCGGYRGRRDAAPGGCGGYRRGGAAAGGRTAPKDVVDVAVGAGSFKTLVSIVSELGLVDTLRGAEALTIFAPDDAAFAKIPAATLQSLTLDDKKAIISRHVVTAKVPAAAVTTGPVPTFGGEIINLVKTQEGGVQIAYNGNTVSVKTADVEASNGVIHIIDSVIL